MAFWFGASVSALGVGSVERADFPVCPTRGRRFRIGMPSRVAGGRISSNEYHYHRWSVSRQLFLLGPNNRLERQEHCPCPVASLRSSANSARVAFDLLPIARGSDWSAQRRPLSEPVGVNIIRATADARAMNPLEFPRSSVSTSRHTSTLDSLEAKGLVVRTPDPRDRKGAFRH